jgi:predicted dinucleotide-binding enzyme
MKIAILGTGMVGDALATKLAEVGHSVMMGSRTANSEASQKWLSRVGGKGKTGTFAEAAAFGEIIFDCTNGANSVAALKQAGSTNLGSKILIQVSNPLDFSKGMPPSLTVCNTDSLGEQIQREFPKARVVKVLNTVNCQIMVKPALVPGDHNLFLCGNDAAARKEMTQKLCEWFGWKAANIIDLGDLTAARGMEMLMPLWMRLFGLFGNPVFNFNVVRST